MALLCNRLKGLWGWMCLKFRPLLSHRAQHLLACQDVVDYIHSKLEAGEFVSDQHCIDTFGKAKAYAFFHEMEKEGIDIATNIGTTKCLEWMHHSRHFKCVWVDGLRRSTSFWLSIVVAIFGFCTGMKECRSAPKTPKRLVIIDKRHHAEKGHPACNQCKQAASEQESPSPFTFALGTL